MLGIARSRYAPPVNLSFISLNAIGVLFGTIYNGATPDLYENNSHHQMGWVVTWIVSVQAVLGVINAVGSKERRSDKIPTSHHHIHGENEAEPYRYSRDSGQGTEPHTPQSGSPNQPPLDLNVDWARRSTRIDLDDDDSSSSEKHALLGYVPATRWLSDLMARFTSIRILCWTSFAYDAIDRVVLLLDFALLLSGVVVYAGIFRGVRVFSGMAHFVKGGIFFWFGVLALGRCMGSFADMGWAWNMKPPAAVVGRRKASAPTMEFVESFLIFLYGATNVFLEHLGSTDGIWSAQDLEHVSISVMFFGSGLVSWPDLLGEAQN